MYLLADQRTCGSCSVIGYTREFGKQQKDGGGSYQKFSQGYGAFYLQWYESFCTRLAAVEVSFLAFLFAFSQVLFFTGFVSRDFVCSFTGFE